MKKPAVLSARPAVCKSSSCADKLNNPLLERILKLSKKEYEVFLEFDQGWEIDEIAKRLRKDVNAIYTMVWHMRPKLGIETLARLRSEATRYVLSDVRRQERHFVFVEEPQV